MIFPSTLEGFPRNFFVFLLVDFFFFLVASVDFYFLYCLVIGCDCLVLN